MYLKFIALYFLGEKMDAERRDEGIETNRLIMKDGKIHKNTL